MAIEKVKKLTLNKETLRPANKETLHVLSDEQLNEAQGGATDGDWTGIAWTIWFWVCGYCTKSCSPTPAPTPAPGPTA